MRPTLASSLPHWYVLSNTNSMLSVGAIALSQNAEMASRPRCPLPSGSKCEGPMGSSTTASSAKTASQAPLSLAATASRERLPAECAGDSVFMRRSSSSLRSASSRRVSLLPTRVNVGVGEPLHRILLLLDRRVEAQAVENPGDHDV